MDEMTWVRQQRIKKMSRFALAGTMGLLFAALLARPFYNQSQAVPLGPPAPHALHEGPPAPPEPPRPHHPKMALSAAQISASVATATAAQPGLVTKADGERDDAGRTVCVVDVQGQDGGHYHVGVDVASDKVLQVEAH